MKTHSHIITSNKRAAQTQPSPTDAGRSTHGEGKLRMSRPAFLPSQTTPPFPFGLLHSSPHLFCILSVEMKRPF